MQSGPLLSQLIFVPVGAAMMERNPWTPMMVSVAVEAVGFVVAILLVPETLSSNRASTSSGHETSPLIDRGEARGLPQTFRAGWRSFCTRWSRLSSWASKNAKIAMVLTCFLALYLGEQSDGTLLLQYTSKRLGWSLAKASSPNAKWTLFQKLTILVLQASYLLSLRAGVILIVLAVGIPVLSGFMLHYLHLHKTLKDKRIAQVSGCFLVAGSVAIFFASSSAPLICGQVLFCLGHGFAVPARSLITSMVDQAHLGTVFTLVSVMTYMGLLAGGPLLAAMFQWGMRLGDFWMGMPFLVSGVCFAFALLVVSILNPNK